MLLELPKLPRSMLKYVYHLKLLRVYSLLYLFIFVAKQVKLLSQKLLKFKQIHFLINGVIFIWYTNK